MKKLTQKERILQLLKENPAGINSFGVARDIALQLPTRVFELRQQGHTILSFNKNDGSVDYILTASTDTDHTKTSSKPVFVGNTAYLD